jgi:hypothetical protein
MLRRRLALAGIIGALATVGGRAHAAGGWVSSTPTFNPIEQRVAVAATPGRTVLWTSLRFSDGAGKLGIVVPAPPGSSLDLRSDAWFEALEVATAPRLFPPDGVTPFCPGKSGPPNVFQLDGQVAHTISLVPQNVAVLADAAKVAEWAGQAGLAISQAMLDALGSLGDVRFVGLRFSPPAGVGVTPTLRVVMPGAAPRLPLALTAAGSGELRVTTWVLGPGRADLIGATEVSVSPSTLAWNPKESASDYDERRGAALDADPSRFLIETAGHAPLADTVGIAQGTATIDSVVSTFFERAAAYGDGNFDAATCVAAAEQALAATAPVGQSCPLAALGVITPAPSCTEAPLPTETKPAALRCGPGADDLAIALAGLSPHDAWVTRTALEIPAGALGPTFPVGFAGGAVVDPVLVCGTVDDAACNPDGGAPDGGASSSSSSSSSSGHTSSSGGVIVDYGPSQGPVVVGGVDFTWWDVAQTGLDSGCSCGSSGPDVSEPASTSDGCSSDASSIDTSGCSGDGSGDSCSSGSSDAGSCSGDGSGDSCSSGSSSEACSGSSGGESCSGGSGSGCSGGDFGKCSTSGTGRARGPRFSILLVCALAILAPLRRRGRARREAERAARRAPRP